MQRMADILTSQHIDNFFLYTCMQTYPAQAADKGAQIAQKGAYVGSTVSVFSALCRQNC
jgi:hypothetical protein